MKILILLSLCVLCSIHSSWAVQDILTRGTKLYKIVNKLREANITHATTTELRIAHVNDKITEIGRLITNFREEIDDLEKSKEIDVVFDFIEKFVGNMSATTRIWSSQLRKTIGVIDSVFTTFSRYWKTPNDLKLWKTFAQGYSDLDKKIRNVRIMLSTSRVLPLIVQESAALHLTHCNETSKIQHFLNHLFQALATSEVKTLAMLSYITMINFPETDGWRGLLDDHLMDFRKRLMIYASQFSSLMDEAPKDMTACDPPNSTWIRDETYFEMERTEQVVILHYYSLFRPKNCHNPLENGWLTYDSERDSCNGYLSDCKYSGWLEVCRLEQSNGKRYEWIKAADGNYGTDVNLCNNGTTSAYEGISNLIKSHCFCKCTEENRNWISLEPVKTNTARNMVATGIRFVRRDGVLHVQVKEGKLLADGWIDKNTENWIPLPENPKLAAITSTKKKFYLDDIILKENYLAVGVQFHDNDGFFIGVNAQAFNFSSGKLQSNTYNDILKHGDYRQLFFPRKNSIYTNRTHIPDSNKHWIELQMSDLKDDAGQSMLPLFDGIAVEASSPVGGIGMIHKGVEDHAGFISPRLYPLLYKNYLSDFIQREARDRRVC